MSIEVQVDSKHVEQMVVDAILKASIGDRIREAIDAVFKRAVDRDYIIQGAVAEEVKKAVRTVAIQIMDEKKDEIAKLVRESITDNMIKTFVSNVVMNAIERKD